tara:strand:+ start:103105 stop:104112 length:1008 start_codon:yes stop_codon:yes gene_type:complete
MSKYLKIVIYPQDFGMNESCETLFHKISKRLDNWEYFTGIWDNYSVRTNIASNKPDFGGEGLVSSDAIIKSLAKSEIKNKRYFSSSMFLPCWTLIGNELKKKDQAVELTLSLWDPDFANASKMYQPTCAEICIGPVNDHFMIFDEMTSEPDETHSIFAKVLKNNLEIIRQLILLFINSTEPLSLKAFMNTGWEIPFNSHVTYFANPESAIKDLEIINDLWLGNYEIEESVPPLKIYQPKKHAWFYNTLRPEEQRREIWEEYSELLPMLKYITPNIVEQAWGVTQSVEDGWFDIQRIHKGALVFSSKYFLNTFVSQMYLDILEIASHLEKENKHLL